MADPVLNGSEDHITEMRRALEGLLGVPATEGNEVTVLRNGDQIFPAMLEAIAGARHTIDFLTFIYWSGEIGQTFAEALAERASQGVRVRVLLDAVGARRMDDDLLDTMTDGGCDVRWFRPVTKGGISDTNHRTHRKVLICDEEVSFTGGVGIADEWRGDARDETEWRDTHFRIVGPATDGLRAAFLDNWAETGGELFEPGVDRFPDQPQPGTSAVQVIRGAAETGWSDIATLLRALLRLATERVRITTAYFNPDDKVADLICEARERGVDVQLLVPGENIDKQFVRLLGRDQYDRLTEAGVEICEFQPTMLHAKVMTVDGVVASVGSANINHRSTEFDEEVNAVIFDPEVVRILDEHFEDDRRRSGRIPPERWEQPTGEKLKTGVLKLVRKKV